MIFLIFCLLATVGVEVKPGQLLKVQPDFGKLIHISQVRVVSFDIKLPFFISFSLLLIMFPGSIGGGEGCERSQVCSPSSEN